MHDKFQGAEMCAKARPGLIRKMLAIYKAVAFSIMLLANSATPTNAATPPLFLTCNYKNVSTKGDKSITLVEHYKIYVDNNIITKWEWFIPFDGKYFDPCVSNIKNRCEYTYKDGEMTQVLYSGSKWVKSISRKTGKYIQTTFDGDNIDWYAEGDCAKDYDRTSSSFKF